MNGFARSQGSRADAQAHAPTFQLECALEHEGQRLPVFPILLPATWERASIQVCEPVLRGVRLPHIPFIAPVYFLGEPGVTEFRRIYIRAEQLVAMGKTYPEVVRESLENLRRRRASWSLLMPSIALCDSDYLAAERLYDAAFLAEAAVLLGGPGEPLVAAVPRRGRLFVTLLSQITRDPAHALAFAGMMAQMFREGREHAISPWPFVIGDGRTNTILEIS